MGTWNIFNDFYLYVKKKIKESFISYYKILNHKLANVTYFMNTHSCDKIIFRYLFIYCNNTYYISIFIYNVQHEYRIYIIINCVKNWTILKMTSKQQAAGMRKLYIFNLLFVFVRTYTYIIILVGIYVYMNQMPPIICIIFLINHIKLKIIKIKLLINYNLFNF